MIGSKRKPFFEAIATLVGTVIGAGIFGIPYIIAKSGWAIGLAHIFILGFIILLINLYVSEITLKIKGKKQLTGYAEKIFGKPGKAIITFTMVFGILGSLIAYLIGGGYVLHELTTLFNPFIWSLVFFVFASTIIFFDLKAVKNYELKLSFIMIFLVVIICILALPYSRLSNLIQPSFSFYRMFLPYGVILFAFLGAVAIPEMRQELKGKEKQMKKAIIIGSIIPFVIYAIFSFIVISVTGSTTTQVATIGLGEAIGRYMVALGNLLAIFAMTTSFLALGLGLKWMLQYDYKFNKYLAWSLTCLVPLILFLAGARNFIKMLSITGAIAGGIEGMALVLMAYKAKKLGERKPEYQIPINLFIITIISLLFIAGIVYQFLF